MVIVWFLLIILQSHFSQFYSQAKDQNEIDNLLSIADKQSKNFNFNQSILISKSALELSRKNKNKIGIIKSNYQIALDLCNLGNYDESFDYIKNIESDYNDYVNDNYEFNIRLADIKGRNYLAQGFNNQAKKEFRKEIYLSENHKNQEDIYRGKIYAYTQLSASCDIDSSYFYLRKILLLRDKVSSKDDFYFAYCNLSDYFIGKNQNLDSAIFYNNEAIKLGKSINSRFLYIGILQKSDLLFRKRQYKESILYAYQGLEIAKSKKRSEEVLASYKLLAKNYKELGDYQLQSKFLDEYSKMNDSIFRSRQSGIQASADMILAVKDESDAKKDNYSLYLILVILIFIILLVFSIGKKRFYNRTHIIPKNDELVKEIDEKLPSASYDEIIHLAKSNSAEFLFHFKEVYPHFSEKLLAINPRLQNSELIFCAYLKLQFSTKEIASFTFVSPKAVQNRKNRLRKKLNIPSEADINIWMDSV